MKAPLLLAALMLPAAALAADWKIAAPGGRYRFPEDHGVHRDYKTEWWYFTGQLRDASGGEFGYQVTFFRDGVRAPGAEPKTASRLILDDVKFAHFAVTDVAGRRFFFRQKTSRGAFGEAGFGAAGRLAWIEGWSLEQTKAGAFRLKAQDGGQAVDLLLSPEKAYVIQGPHGISQKADGAGHASYYYSATRLDTRGELTSGGNARAVTGESWFDHEWATNGLTPEQIGWNWFSLQLDDGAELMLYQMRTRGGGIDPNSSGTFIRKDGECVYLTRADYTLSPGGPWKSGATGASYPLSWKLGIPKLKLTVQITTPVPNQELALGAISYWEGLIEVRGARASAPVTGHGYMELTGYAAPLTEMSSAPE